MAQKVFEPSREKTCFLHMAQISYASSLLLSSVAVKPSLFQTWAESPKTGFFHDEAHLI